MLRSDTVSLLPLMTRRKTYLVSHNGSPSQCLFFCIVCNNGGLFAMKTQVLLWLKGCFSVSKIEILLQKAETEIVGTGLGYILEPGRRGGDRDIGGGRIVAGGLMVIVNPLQCFSDKHVSDL
ncbi:hypothetical protein L6452_35690 [Arctium lappa]|uniref:Uncharacterized protein n=1 Tax=Arctium lappa TaxID=4217 RepID=A0ACB8Y801_ARCLA|nr:hypothetical protein L6452_35690 [Arctium lappa]